MGFFSNWVIIFKVLVNIDRKVLLVRKYFFRKILVVNIGILILFREILLIVF